MTSDQNEILDLAGMWCDERLSESSRTRLEHLLSTSDEALNLFVDYVQLHGQLQWEGGWTPLSLPAEAVGTESGVTVAGRRTDPVRQARYSGRRAISIAAAAIISVTAVVVLVVSQLQLDQGAGTDHAATGNEEHSDGSSDRLPDGGVELLEPIRLDSLTARNIPGDNDAAGESAVANGPVEEGVALHDDATVVARIDELLSQSWQENSASPSVVASDEEWVRRAWLTFTGRIPTVAEAQEFIASRSPRKRTELVERLLHNEQSAESLAVIWTNLLIGRSGSRGIDAEALFVFLEGQFRENRPWNETVNRLLAAEGRNDQVGETNFLLAHLNNQATPATAVVAKLFFCEQVHCMQCHDHPTASGLEQEQFWELNAFFKQAVREPITLTLPDGTEKRVWRLTDAERGGVTHFETRNGQQRAVLPEFAGHRLTGAASEDRRQALTEFLDADSEHRVARAMVNRMWAHFFGAGFTSPIDDMGPHNPPTHPELLETLTTAFVESDYDVRRLMRWIAMSDAWQRASSVEELNADLDPRKGGMPVFDRVYSRFMTPEEVYESIRVAVRSVGRQPLDSSIGSAHRREWVGQFVRSLENDENEETLTFEGDVSQALLMMNGEEIERALPLCVGAMLQAPENARRSAGELLTQLSLATIAREPSDAEEQVFRNRYRSLSSSMPLPEALSLALQDMLWGYLNSSEFITVH